MLYKKGLTELSELLSKKEISSKEIAISFADRIETLDSGINSYITFNRDELLEKAEESDTRRAAGTELSPFDGIPVAIKDNINTKGVRTTCASKILENFIPPYSAHSYEKLSSKGILLLGKTNMDEFAMGSSTENSYFGTTKNPYDKSRVSGGSSGGSAASVASFMAPASLGSDTGGSIRQPAAFCGLTGIKPTYGRVSRFGLAACASSMDQIGTLGRSVKDAASLLEIISGHDPKDSTSVKREVDFSGNHLTSDVKGMVIGVPDEYFKGISPEIDAKIKEKLKELENAGARIEPINLKFTEYASSIFYIISSAEASSNLARYDGVKYGYRSGNAANLVDLYTKSRSEGFGKEAKRRILLGNYSLSSGNYDDYYIKALHGRSLIIKNFQDAFLKVDAIISPTTATTAPKIGEMTSNPLAMYMSDILTISANLTGIPALTVPAGVDSHGLPIGLQIMGNNFQEQKILNIASSVEKNCEKISPAI